MSEEIIDSGAGAPSGERPTFLTVLCILSFISAGLAIFTLVGLMALVGAVSNSDLVADAMAAAEASGDVTVSTGGSIGWAYIGITLILVIVGLFGVIKMWKLKKQGFMIYAGAGVVGIIVEMTMGVGFNAVSFIITAAFIVMYYLNLKHMH